MNPQPCPPPTLATEVEATDRDEALQIRLMEFIRTMAQIPVVRRTPGLWIYSAIGVGVRLAEMDPDLAHRIYQAIITSDRDDRGREVVNSLADDIAHLVCDRYPLDRPDDR